jgi:hypothetical protein
MMTREAKRRWLQSLYDASCCTHCGRSISPSEPVWIANHDCGAHCAECERRSVYKNSRWLERECVTCRRKFFRWVSSHEESKYPCCCRRCYASATVKRQAARQKAARTADRAPLACAVCSTVFTPDRKGAVTCSPACRQKAFRLRKKADAGGPEL